MKILVPKTLAHGLTGAAANDHRRCQTCDQWQVKRIMKSNEPFVKHVVSSRYCYASPEPKNGKQHTKRENSKQKTIILEH